MICNTCDREGCAKLPLGKSFLLRCPRCCSHKQGVWLITEGFVGYREGFNTWVCSAGCGQIMKEEQIL